MSQRIDAGARVRTVVELPVANCPDDSRAPIGSEGVVRKVFGDALGGFLVDLTIGDTVSPAVVYDNQVVPAGAPTTTKAATHRPESNRAEPETQPTKVSTPGKQLTAPTNAPAGR